MELSKKDVLGAFPVSPDSVHVRDVMRVLRVAGGGRAQFKAMVEELVVSGDLLKLRGRRFTRPPLEGGFVGTLTLTRGGYGFIASENDEPDLYVHGKNLAGAMHRDRVDAVVVSSRPGRKEGRITRVLERGTHSFVGVVHLGRHAGWLVPRDERLPDRVTAVDVKDVRHGDLVAARFVEWPDASGRLPRAEIVRSLARSGEAASETDIIVYDLGIPIEFAEGVQQEADSFSEELAPEDLECRRDLRDRPLVTVDPATARDFDDAVHAERRPDGGWRMTVAIADVAHYVHLDGSIDESARTRGTSVYLPDRVIPMLPDRLSGDLCSLRPGVDRCAMVTEFTVDPQGTMSDIEFYEAVIRSHGRFTYDRAGRLLGVHPDADGPETEGDELDEFSPVLFALLDATRKLRGRRRRRGYLAIDVAEPRVILDEEGDVERIGSYTRHEAHLMIEESMLAANEAVATHFVERELPTIFRVHASPPDSGLERFRNQAASLGFRMEGKASARELSRAMKKCAEHPRAWLLNICLLRAMSRAEYRAEVRPHFGLGLDAYLHFTSPIRRYPDLVSHRLLKALLHGEELPALDQLDETARASSRSERLALDAEREVLLLYKTLYLQKHLGDVFEGTIVGVTGSGVFVLLEGTNCEGFLPLAGMTDDHYDLDQGGSTLVGSRSGAQYRLGHRIEVRLVDVNISRRRVQLDWIRRLED